MGNRRGRRNEHRVAIETAKLIDSRKTVEITNVLVIGATGFIGPYVIEHLVQHGHRVAAFHRGETTAALSGDPHVIRGDRNALADALPEIDAFDPDVVIDLLLYTEAQAEQAVQVFRERVRRFVAISSGDVYRNYDGLRGEGDHPPDPAPLPESAPLRETRYPYRGYDLDLAYAEDYDKILVEEAVLNASAPSKAFDGTVVRLPVVYGPGDPQHRLAEMLTRMEDHRPAILKGEDEAEWTWTHGYVENVGAAIAHAATHPDAGGAVYNIGEAETPTVRERIQTLADVTGWRGDIVTMPAEDLPEHLQLPFDCRYEMALDTSRIRDELGFEDPVSFEEALERTAAWERAKRETSGDADSDARRTQYAAEDAALESLS